MSNETQPTAVLLMAYGGPDSLADIEPYLLDVRGGRATPPELVEKVRQRYARIGGRSPLLEITRAQAAALEVRLNQAGAGRYRTYVGMRHWRPYIHTAVEQIAAGGASKVIALCMAPQTSRMSSGAYREKLEQARRELPDPGSAPEIDFIPGWHAHPLFIRALAEKTRAAAARLNVTGAPILHLFTAHSLPAAMMEQGDPYDRQVGETAALLAAELGLQPDQWQRCYQSAGAANGRWLGPDLEETLARAAGQGVKNVVITTIGFVADHVEVLYDLDVEAREQSAALGLCLERSESLNASPAFIEALARIVLERVR